MSDSIEDGADTLTAGLGLACLSDLKSFTVGKIDCFVHNSQIRAEFDHCLLFQLHDEVNTAQINSS